jgi:DNA invertase Pin-like site-specific DNA recombinase
MEPEMASGRFVSYLRVSTDKQGASGLGLEAQRKAVEDYLNGGSWNLEREFVEVESGKRADRPELTKALAYAKALGATLVIAKLDRLSRNLAFIVSLQEAHVRFVCADMPEANELTIHLLAAVAQHERKMISQRTKDALAAAKARGTKLGNPNGAAALRRAAALRGTKVPEAALEAVRAGADRHAQVVFPVIEELRREGISSLEGLARELNARGIQTARGGQWYATTVANLLARISRHI